MYCEFRGLEIIIFAFTLRADNLFFFSFLLRSWAVHTTEGIYSIIDGLAEVPNIERLHLHFNHTSPDKHQLAGIIPLRRFPALRQLSIEAISAPISFADNYIQQLRNLHHTTPSFTRLELAIPFIGFDPREQAESPRNYLHEIVQDVPKGTPFKLQILRVNGWTLKLDSTTLPHLKFLTSLDICQMRGPSSIPEIWDRLNEARIHLEDVATRDVGPQLVNYLKSYSGLKRFELRRNLCRDRVGLMAETYADIYRIVLPMHKDSLLSLKLLDKGSIHGCIHAEYIPLVSLCKKLSLLSAIVRRKDVDDGNSMVCISPLTRSGNDFTLFR